MNELSIYHNYANKFPSPKNKKTSDSQVSLKNLHQQLQTAKNNNDSEKVEVINALIKEIEKLIIIKNIRAHDSLKVAFKDDINFVLQDGSYHLIETILMREIELLATGDIEAIAMLNDIKKEAQKKIDELSNIAQQQHLKAIEIDNKRSANNFQRNFSQENVQYKPMTRYEGFHLQKTLGGKYIQVLDADVKALVGSEIVNSTPEQLSQNIIDEIKHIKRGTDIEIPDQTPSKDHQNDNVKIVTNINTNSIKISNRQKQNAANQESSNKTPDWQDLIKNNEKKAKDKGNDNTPSLPSN